MYNIYYVFPKSFSNHPSEIKRLKVKTCLALQIWLLANNFISHTWPPNSTPEPCLPLCTLHSVPQSVSLFFSLVVPIPGILCCIQSRGSSVEKEVVFPKPRLNSFVIVLPLGVTPFWPLDCSLLLLLWSFLLDKIKFCLNYFSRWATAPDM